MLKSKHTNTFKHDENLSVGKCFIMLYDNNISIWNGLKMTSIMLLLIRIFLLNDI